MLASVKMLLFKSPPSISTRPSHIILTLVVIGLFLHTYRISHSQPQARTVSVQVEQLPEGNASPEELYLGRLGRELSLTKETSWVAWRIQASEQSADWPSVTDVHLDFKSVSTKTINLEQPDRRDLYAKKKMELPVPSSPMLGQTDSSDFLFGVSTTYNRIVHRDYAMVKAWARWFTDSRHRSNGASLVVVLDQAGSAQVEEVDNMLQASGIDCWVTTTEEPMSLARRYFELSRILKTFAANLAANGQDKRWFGLVEDDVFFPSLANLRERLYNYNTDGMHYIALPSERDDWEKDEDTLRTYGGGAIMLTRSAVARVPELPCFVMDGSNSGGPVRPKRWDGLLHGCILEHSEMDMHVLTGFYDPKDDKYDPSTSSYENGLQPLLLRRYEERHAIDINKAHLVTNVCGEYCFMQRYLFRDDWVLVNGISLSHYPGGVTVEAQQQQQQQQPEATENPEGVHARADEEYGKLQLPDRVILDGNGQEDVDRTALKWAGSKETWRLMDSALSKDGEVWQAYVKKAIVKPDTPEAERMDSVIVLIWEHGKITMKS